MEEPATPKHDLDTLREFVAARLGRPVSTVQAGSDISEDFGCIGLDFDSLMEAYGETFQVNMDGYRWYFYTEDDSGCGALFYVPAYQQVPHIPITPAILLDFANKGRWDIAYPEHRPPGRPYRAWVYWLGAGCVLWLIFKVCLL